MGAPNLLLTPGAIYSRYAPALQTIRSVFIRYGASIVKLPLI